MSSAIDMLGRLVAFDTVSAKSNLSLIEHVRDYLAGHGIVCRIVPNEDGTKANLYATIGPDRAGGVALSGHTDVVPVAGQNWSTDPFALVERGGRLYGRGTADMKGFIAVALALVPRFKAMRLKRPIHLCLSYDEEVGCLGAPSLLRLLGTELPKPALAIIGEPTSMKVVNAHKGVTALRTTIIGREAHSSAPHLGANAIQFMGRFIGFLDRLASDLEQAGAAEAISGLVFDPPWTTLNLGAIEGGTALNIIARECSLDWEFRPLPGADDAAILRAVDQFIAKDLHPALVAAAPNGSIVTQTICAVPPLRPEKNGLAEALALQLTGQNATHTAAFASESGQFQDVGISTVMCGPGDIAVAHKPDEFTTREQLESCETFLLRLADWAAA